MMTLRRHIARVLLWWNRLHPSKTLEASLPAYRDASRRERLAKARNDARGIGRARKAKREAILNDMRKAR